MHHLLAFDGSLAISASYAQVAGVPDSAIPRNQANDFLMPFRGRVLASHTIGLTTNQAQLQSPSMRQIAFPELWPPNVGARTAIADLQRYQVYGENGPQFMMNESLGLYASNSSGAAVSLTSGGIWIADTLTPAPAGPQITLVATSTIVLVDGQWILGTLAFGTQLGVGEYHVTGMNVIGDNSIYARLVFPGNTGMRPGVIVQDIETDVNWRDSFRLGRFGSFGRFQFNAPPQIEVFGAVAGSTPFRVLLDVVKVR